jgi:hypothetical protein
MPFRSIYNMPPHKIQHAETNGSVVCDCGGAAFRIGIIVDQVGNSFINVLECVDPMCLKQHPVPDVTSWPKVHCMPFRPPRLPDVTAACADGPCQYGQLCRVLGLCVARGRSVLKAG